MGLFYDAPKTVRDAHFGQNRAYRFTLKVTWDFDKPILNFIGCNPSVADEKKNDPTIERMQSRATDWGYGALIVTNLFAFKSPYPKDLRDAAARGDEVEGWDDDGKPNNEWILWAARQAKMILCGWGTHGDLRDRGTFVQRMLRTAYPEKLHYLKLTAGGHPQHPLYLPYELKPTRWV